jgi:serine/threonine protein kinase
VPVFTDSHAGALRAVQIAVRGVLRLRRAARSSVVSAALRGFLPALPAAVKARQLEMYGDTAPNTAALAVQLRARVVPWRIGDWLVRDARSEFLDGATPESLQLRSAPTAYDLKGAVLLGAGSFGCVVDVAKPDGTRVAAKIARDAEGERAEAVLTGALHDAVSAARASPYVVALVDAYYLRSFSASGSSRSRVLAARVAALCATRATETAADLLAGYADAGMIVIETPVFDRGDLRRAGIAPEFGGGTTEERRAWTFQMTHGLAAARRVAGFLHQDIKSGNVLVRTRDEANPRVAVRWVDVGGRVHVRTFVDTAPSVAAHADYGLSVMDYAPAFSTDVLRESLTNATTTGLHVLGTPGYWDPALGAYTGARTLSGMLARGFAADVWALGLTVLNLWAHAVERPVWVPEDVWVKRQVRDAGPEVRGHADIFVWSGVNDYDEEHPLGGVLGDLWDFDQAQRTPITGDDSLEYLRNFLDAVLISSAFHDDWAAQVSRPWSVYWQWVLDNRARIEAAALHWGGERRYQSFYAYIRERMDPAAAAFVAGCLHLDPEHRARFVGEGWAFDSALFAPWVVANDETPDFVLDLAPQERCRTF